VEWKIDGNVVASKKASDLSPTFDKIVTGTGFSQTRPMKGEVKNFKLRIKSYSTIFFTLKIVLIVFIVFTFLALLFRVRRQWIIYFSSLLHSQIHFVLYCGLMIFIVCLMKSFIIRYTFVGLTADILLIVAVLLFLCLAGIFLNSITQTIFALLISFLFYVIGCVLAIGAFYCFKNQIYQFSVSDFEAIYQSNPSEVWEFLTSFFSNSELVTIAIIPLAIAFCSYQIIRRCIVKNLSLRYFTILFISSLGALFFSINSPNENISASVISFVNQRQLVMQHYAETKKNRTAIDPAVASKNESGELFVLVIGESANRDHFGIYGYLRNTTPWLSSVISKEGWLLFDNGYASYCHTVPSLALALTDANQYNGYEPFDRPSIIDVFKSAGFTTYWISAQHRFSFADNQLTAIAESSDIAIFTNENVDGRSYTTDKKIPIVFREVLSNIDHMKNNLIIINLLCSHAEYANRYPRDFMPQFPRGSDYLGDLGKNLKFVSEVLNPYDTSIAYTDKILSEIFAEIQSSTNKKTFFLYTSDHGEDVFGEKYHNSGIFNFNMVRIPFVFWFSPDFVKERSARMINITRNKSQIFTNDLLFDTLIGLANIKTKLYTSKYDISSNDYFLNDSVAKTMTPVGYDSYPKGLYIKTNEVMIKDDIEYVRQNNVKKLNTLWPQKFLALAADAVGIAYDARKLGFDGIEINIAAQNPLRIGHSTPVIVYQKTANGIVGHEGENKGYQNDMTCNEYLNFAPMKDFKKIWFDMKEVEKLSADQRLEMIVTLNNLDKKYNLKKRVIFETWATEGMEVLSQDGWHTSYYISDQNVPDILKNDAKRNKEIAQQIARIIKKQKYQACSFFAHNYGFVKKYLEPLLSKKIIYHTWALDIPAISSKNMINEVKKNIVVQDKRVKTILIVPESKFVVKGS